MSDTALCDLTATETVALLRAGRVSPLELVDAAIARIEGCDGDINALPIRFFDVARDEARRFRTGDADHAGWLGGLPVAIKDYNDVGGQLTTCGSPIFARHVAAEDDVTVAAMRANGAIPLAKSNVPEFAGANTFNPVWGATHNPWNIERSAGGSSGGAAAALAARMVWLANGSCLGGSLRIPASFCGVVGLRPSPGVVPRGAGLPAFDTLWVDGPMGRTVADVSLLLDAMAGRSARDPFSRPPPSSSFTAVQDRRRPPRRVGFSADLGLSRVDPEVAAICRAAAQRFTECGASVEYTWPDFGDAIETFQTQRAILIAAVRGDLMEKHRAQMGSHIIWNIEKGRALTADQVIRAERDRWALYHRVVAFFEDFDVLALPTVAVPPFPVTQAYPTEIGGQTLQSYIDWMFLTFVVTLTACPAISVPCGFTRDGLPVGLQLVGRPHGDARLLGHARVLEDILGLASLAPPRHRR
jgi:amidase